MVAIEAAAAGLQTTAVDDEEPIGSFLAKLKLEQYAETFVKEDVPTVRVLKTLKLDDLKELGLGIGARRQIFQALGKEG